MQTILIVDDKPINIAVIADYLEGQGYRVITADTGKKGIHTAATEEIHLILLDILMPGMDGFETIQELKKKETTKDIPVIFMTAVHHVEEKVKGFSFGGVDYLTKPIQEEELLARVSTHIQLHMQKKILEENAEKLKNARQEAENSLRIKTLFLSNISHEIRTPMNIILGFADILSKQTENSEHLKYLDEIRKSGNALLSLIDDILELSKIEAGKIAVEPSLVRITTVFNEIRMIFHEKLLEKNLSFFMDIDPALPDILFLDEIRLRQVIFNLTGNAAKFTDTGHIRFSAQAQQINEKNMTLDLVISIADTGVGIPEEDRKQIFETFEQHAFHQKRANGGTGLGLAITRRLVNMMNGDITLKSTKGEGSEFTVTLHRVPFLQEEKHILDPPGRGHPSDAGSYSGSKAGSDETEQKNHGNTNKTPSIPAKPEIIRILEQEISNWEEFRETAFLDDIEAFGERLVHLGRQYMNEQVVEFGNSIIRNVQELEIEKMNETLDNFPDFFIRLRPE